MKNSLKLCLNGCGEWADPRSRNGSRCTGCERARNARRNADPKRQAYSDPGYRAVPLGGVCWLCGEAGADTRDHVPALASMPPGEWVGVVRPAHRACNSAKGAS